MAIVFVAAFVATALLVGVAPRPSGAAGVPLYPDLKTLAPRELKLDRADITPDLSGVFHNVLRFSNNTFNVGPGPVIVNAAINPTTKSGPSTQRVMNSDGTFTDLALNNNIYWHEAHHHYHFDNWGRYQLWTQSGYNAWIASGRSVGAPSYTGVKTTSCIVDEEFTVSVANAVYPGPYGLSGCDVDGQGNIHMGLSVGWGDTYDWYRQDQWIDLNQDTLGAGTYVLRSVADPNNFVYESASKSDTSRENEVGNEATTTFSINGSGALVDSNPPTGTVSINRVDATTTSTSVSVSVMGRDDVSGVNQFRLSNNGTNFTTFNYTSSGSVSTTVAFNLADGATGGSSTNGIHTVYAQVHDNAGNWGPVFTDTIDLQNGGPPPPPPSAYSQAVANDNAVSYWRLGETSGTNAADSRGSNPGVYTGLPTLGVASLLTNDGDKAATFSGTNQSVDIASSASLSLASTVSLEAWIKPTSIPATGGFASVLTKPESYSLQFNGPKLEFTIMQAGTRRRLQAATGAIVAGTRYHIAGTYDGTTQRLYINGVLAVSAALTGAITTNTNPLYIASWNGTSEFLAGTIDEVALYPTALSATQVSTHYSAGTNPGPSTTQLTVSRSGTGTGTVTSAPAGINCGTTCAAGFTTGSSVTLTAAPAGGSVFAGWSGGGCSGTGTCALTLNTNTTITATFNVAPSTLTVLRTGAGNGNVTSAPAGLDCGVTCAAGFTPGTAVTLTATPNAGSGFGGWSGGGCSGTGRCTLTVNANVTVTATFTANSSSPSTYSQVVQGDAPVSYWRLDEPSGTTASDRAGSNPGTYQGAVTHGVAGLLATDTDTAAAFSGSSQLVRVPSSASLSLASTVSLEAWIKPARLPAAGAFASIMTKPESYSLQFNGPKLEFTIMQSGTRRRLQAAAGAIVAGSIYHVVGTYAGSTQRLYINGTQVASAALTSAITTNSNPLNIASWNGTSEFMTGTIDDVAVYATALSASQIAEHYSTATTTTSAASSAGPSAPAAIALAGTSPVATGVDDGLGRIYVTRNRGEGRHSSNGVSVIDARSRQIIAEVTTGSWGPSALAVDAVRHLVYVTAPTWGALADHSVVAVIDGRTNKIVRRIAVGPGPKAIAVNAKTNRVYVTDQNGTDAGQAIAVIDGATGKVVSTIQTGPYARYYENPLGLAVDSRSNTVYATNPLQGTVYVIDGATNRVQRSLALGDEPTAVAVDTSTGRAYVAHAGRGSTKLSVIDGPADAAVRSIHLGGPPRGIAVDALGGAAYVSTAGGGTAVVQTATGRVTGLLDCGPGAYGVAVTADGSVVVADRTDETLFVVPRRARPTIT